MGGPEKVNRPKLPPAATAARDIEQQEQARERERRRQAARRAADQAAEHYSEGRIFRRRRQGEI